MVFNLLAGFFIVPILWVFIVGGSLTALAIPKFQETVVKAKMSEIPPVMAQWEQAVLAGIAETGTLPADPSGLFFETPSSAWFEYSMEGDGTSSVTFSARILSGKKIGRFGNASGRITSTMDANGAITHAMDFGEKYLPDFVNR